MKLILQPGDGIAPLLAGIKSAKKSVDIVIFRFDWGDVEAALKAAVGRGVAVHALIAYTNRGGERNLRKLEMRLLGAGVTVVRTAKDLLRYHDKMMIIDDEVLYVLSFNFTHLDIDHSRGFGVITKHRKSVQEAIKLFKADTTRTSYSAGLPTFVVSPANARKELASFMKKAQKELMIYDPKIADTQMLDILEERAKTGVKIRFIGKLGRPSSLLTGEKLVKIRLHTRTIIRDHSHVFVGSQSLRQAELDSRRELGIIFHDSKVVSTIVKTFEADWAAIEQAKSLGESKGTEEASKARKVVKKAVKGLIKDQPHLAPIAQEAVEQVVEKAGNADMSHKEVQETVKEAIQEAVKTEKVQDAIREAIKDAVQDASDSK